MPNPDDLMAEIMAGIKRDKARIAEAEKVARRDPSEFPSKGDHVDAVMAALAGRTSPYEPVPCRCGDMPRLRKGSVGWVLQCPSCWRSAGPVGAPPGGAQTAKRAVIQSWNRKADDG